MSKIIKIILSTIVFFTSISSKAHIQHYDNLKVLKYDLYRNNKNIGTHEFTFTNIENGTRVDSVINFQIKKLGIVIYKYNATGSEIYNNEGQLIKFHSTTNQNGKKKFVNMDLKDNKYIIDGSSYQGDVPLNYLIGTWWNHSIIKAPAQISAVSGRIIKQKVEFIGKETLSFDDKKFETLHFRFSSSDKNLKKDKRLNTDIWYEEKNLIWVHARFKKSGIWEYKLNKIDMH